jgi:hypothetical protein
MTSDKLDELSPDRAELFAALLREQHLACDFPELGSHQFDGVIVQRVSRADGGSLVNLFNTRGAQVRRVSETLAPYGSRLLVAPDDPLAGLEPGAARK